MQVNQYGICFLFLCQLRSFHFAPLLALEGVLLIRAVSPATPQGSVSQSGSDTHIPGTQTHAHIPEEPPNAASARTHPYPYRLTLAHTHTHTRFHLAAILTSHP